MKITKSLNITILTLLGLTLPMTGKTQVYTLSTPISGSMTMTAQDLNGPSGSSGGFLYNFNTLTETIYLNPVAGTIEQVGVISGTPSASDISFQETQQVPGQFPNPPSAISGNVTVNLAPSGGVLSFDTGPQPVTWNAGLGLYTFNGNFRSLANFQGSYSLTTGSQTYSGSFTYGLALNSIWNSEAFQYASTINYPNSLSLSGLGTAYGLWTASPGVVADVVANNGFNMELSVGDVTFRNYSDIGENFQWYSPGTITATMVPEPGSLSLLAFGMFGITLLRRHQR